MQLKPLDARPRDQKEFLDPEKVWQPPPLALPDPLGPALHLSHFLQGPML